MGFLTNLVSGVMDNVVENQRQHLNKMETEKHNIKMEKLEQEAKESVEDFKNYVESTIKNKELLKDL